ncbi:glutamate--tRNA ligase [bacterium]|nr:glutamate--tRNA ligase [bacterium]
MTNSKIRVRFAPSPTGYLHVGGARTAIFNWLYARATGGKFLLRIEDTDPERSRGELTQVILDSLTWLGIESDEPIVYQSDHFARFTEVAMELVEQGAAYLDFTTKEELEEMRKASQERKEPAFRFKADTVQMRADAPARLKAGDSYAVRFAAPPQGIEWNDLVHGSVKYEGGELEDFVLLRSDGSPTYHLSVVCDDHDMGMTHVLRGDDHISNTPKQIAIYKAMHWPVPEFGHVPLILGPDKKRLSKRTGATSVGEFQEKGYLPDALFNFLTLLGWSPGKGDREIFSREELIDVFTTSGIQPKSAVFDEAKLEWMNGEHLRALDEESALRYLMDQKGKAEVDEEYLRKLLPLVRPRMRLPVDLFEGQSYFFTNPAAYDEKGVKKYLGDQASIELMTDYAETLAAATSFDPESLESQLREFADARNVKAAAIIHSVRLALTGKTVSPGLFDVMECLGRETVLSRLRKATRILLQS